MAGSIAAGTNSNDVGDVGAAGAAESGAASAGAGSAAVVGEEPNRLAQLLAARRPADPPTDAEILDAAAAFDKLICWAQAGRAKLLSAFAERRPGDEPMLESGDTPSIGSRWAPDEVGLAMGRSRQTARAMLRQATILTEVLPDVLAAMESGVLDEGRASVLCDLVPLLGPAAAAKVAGRVLPRAGHQTWSQFRAAVRRAVLRVDPDGERDRHATARGQRRVSVRQVEDGMATLWALLPGPEAAEAWEMLTRLAKGLDFPGDPDPRTLDARRADLLVDLLTGKLALDRDFTGPADSPDQLDIAETESAESGTAGSESGTAESGSAESGTAESGPAGPEPERPEIHASDSDSGLLDADPDLAAHDGSEHDGSEHDGSEHDIAQSVPGIGASAAAAGPVPADAADPVDGAGAGTGRLGQPPPPSGGRVRDRVPVVHLGISKPLVQIVIGLDTLLGVRDDPVELVGHGPVLAAAARAVAADGVWKRLVADPLSGALLDHGRSTYRPPAALRDFVTARDQTCRFPGCGRRARDGEIDHLQARVDDGDTDRVNLHGLCVHHHHVKHRPGWQVQVLHDGRLLWTAPTGHQYLSEPYDYRNHLPGNDIEQLDPAA